MVNLRTNTDGRRRCGWCGDDPLYVRYHDEEWGRAVHDEQRLFAKLCLEGFQCGLSWITILRKRDRFLEVFRGFDVDTVAAMTARDVRRLLGDPGIVRNRAKIEATITNARAVQALRAEGRSLAGLLWSFSPSGRRAAPRRWRDLPARTEASEAMSRGLRGAGFRFVGPTTAYALMQSVGMVNDHVAGCAFRKACADERG